MYTMNKKPNEFTDEEKTNYLSYIVFEPASIRVNDSDILYMGNDVKTAFYEIYDKVEANLNEAEEENLPCIVIKNRLEKINQMLNMLNSYDNIIITKFFSRIWRRCSYVSNIGEMLIDSKTYLKLCPEKKDKLNDLYALRVDEEDFEDTESKDEDDKDEDDIEDKEENDEKEKVEEIKVEKKPKKKKEVE